MAPIDYAKLQADLIMQRAEAEAEKILSDARAEAARLSADAYEKAKEMGFDTVIIFGNPDNYVARGFKSCIRFNVCLDGGYFPAPLLVKELKENQFDGRRWFYHESDASAPCMDEEAVENFDKNFPPKEKGWQPSQEEFFIHSHSQLNG